MKKELDFIYSRRSIRKFTGKVISDELIQELLEAGMAAPSAVAKDPWRFIVATEKKNVAAITDALPHGKMLPQAGCAIVVCGDVESAAGGQLSYMIQDCSAAIENILLAVNALGLGAVWLGVHPNEDRIESLRASLGFPENILPVGVICVGYPAEEQAGRTRFDAKYVHRERW